MERPPSPPFQNKRLAEEYYQENKLLFKEQASRSTYISSVQRTTPTTQPKQYWVDLFEQKTLEDPYKPNALVAMEVIHESLRIDDSNTIQEMVERMKFVRQVITTCPSAGWNVDSSGDYFTRFITKDPMALESAKTIEEARDIIVNRGRELISTYSQSPVILTKKCFPVLQAPIANCGGAVRVVTLGWSRAIFMTIMEAQRKGLYYDVRVIEGIPQSLGRKMVKDLKAGGVYRAALVPDLAMQSVLSLSSVVYVEALGFNYQGDAFVPFGTCLLVNQARQLGKKVYVFADSLQFGKVRMGETAATKIRTMDDFILDLDGDESGLKLKGGKTPQMDMISAEDITQILSNDGPFSSVMLDDFLIGMISY